MDDEEIIIAGFITAWEGKRKKALLTTGQATAAQIRIPGLPCFLL